MNKSIAKIASGTGTIIHSLVIPFSILVFTIYYKPHKVFDLLTMENASFAFNSTILYCIILVSTTITRVWLYLLEKHRRLSALQYLTWSLAEILITSLFCALYLVLISTADDSFFDVAGQTFANLIAIAVYPYAFLWLGFEVYALKNQDVKPADDNSLLRFYDEYKKLRFVIAPEAVIFIKSEDNYVQINYLDKGRAKKFILRSSMRALEESLSKRGLVRCHRSYFINPSYIKIVHRDTTGLIVAELNQDGYESIPISRKYQEEIARLL